MVTLVKMNQAELDEYLQTAIRALADELMRSNGWSAEQSMKASRQSFHSLLPGSLVDTPNQFLRTIHADGKSVGILWFGVRGEKEAVVWDILVYPPYRNRGHGKAALQAMEHELRKMTIRSVVLNVFAHNSTAFRMYSTLGYEPVATKMRKQL